MIRRILLALMISGGSFGGLAEAADIPLSLLLKPPKSARPQLVHRKHVAIAPRAGKTRPLAGAVANEDAPAANTTVAEAPPPDAPTGEDPSRELQLSWFLGSLAAHADGARTESSASMEGNLVVGEPGYVTSPYMVIEMSGLIVKTADTTVRLDVKVGSVQRTVNWKSADVKSGRFSVSVEAPMAEGELPGYFPVSALLFVTREKQQGVAMVTLEKIRVRVGKVAQVAAK